MDSAVVKKLRIPSGEPILILNAPSEYLQNTSALPEGTEIHTRPQQDEYGFIHLFVSSVTELEEWISVAVNAAGYDKLFWISYPKKTSKIKTDISRDTGWDAVSEAGYEGVSLISIDQTWSAMRFRPVAEIKMTRKERTGIREASTKKISSREKVVEVPQELEDLFAVHLLAKERFKTLSYTGKKEFVTWITSAKREETKKKRLEQTIEKLEQGLKGPYDKSLAK